MKTSEGSDDGAYKDEGDCLFRPPASRKASPQLKAIILALL